MHVYAYMYVQMYMAQFINFITIIFSPKNKNDFSFLIWTTYIRFKVYNSRNFIKEKNEKKKKISKF